MEKTSSLRVIKEEKKSQISKTTEEHNLSRSMRTSNDTNASGVVVSRQPKPEQAKMAAVAVTLNIRVRSADMPPTMLEHALRHTFSTLNSSATTTTTTSRPNLTFLARSLKQEFDKVYGPAWHCVAGKSFGSFVTHTSGGFVYFTVDDSLSFLLFKTEVRLVL